MGREMKRPRKVINFAMNRTNKTVKEEGDYGTGGTREELTVGKG